MKIVKSISYYIFIILSSLLVINLLLFYRNPITAFIAGFFVAFGIISFTEYLKYTILGFRVYRMLSPEMKMWLNKNKENENVE